jgi:hypothetical protein
MQKRGIHRMNVDKRLWSRALRDQENFNYVCLCLNEQVKVYECSSSDSRIHSFYLIQTPAGVSVIGDIGSLSFPHQRLDLLLGTDIDYYVTSKIGPEYRHYELDEEEYTIWASEQGVDYTYRYGHSIPETVQEAADRIYDQDPGAAATVVSQISVLRWDVRYKIYMACVAMRKMETEIFNEVNRPSGDFTGSVRNKEARKCLR